MAQAATARARLTTGWEPDTPSDDTILRSFLDAHAESLVSPVRAHGGHVVSNDDVFVCDTRSPNGFYNGAVLRRPLRHDGPDPVLDEVESAISSGSGDVILWSAWPTPDLSERGWDLVGHPPMLIRPPSDPPAVRDDLHVEEVRDARGIEDWSRVVVEGYPVDELRPYREGSLFDERVLADARYRFWVGYVDDEPAAVGTMFSENGLAVLTMGVTLPVARGRGFWYEMARRRLAGETDAIAAGIFSDMSRPLAQKIGFIPVTRFTLWERRRA